MYVNQFIPTSVVTINGASLQLLPLESFCMPLIVPAVSPHDTVDILNSRQKSYKCSVSLSLCLILNIVSSL